MSERITNNELIDVLGRAPSGTEVFVRFQGVTFAIIGARVEYDHGVWLVEIDPNLNTTESARP